MCSILLGSRLLPLRLGHWDGLKDSPVWRGFHSAVETDWMKITFVYWSDICKFYSFVVYIFAVRFYFDGQRKLDTLVCTIWKEHPNAFTG